jgi:hypothetical protein
MVAHLKVRDRLRHPSDDDLEAGEVLKSAHDERRHR